MKGPRSAAKRDEINSNNDIRLSYSNIITFILSSNRRIWITSEFYNFYILTDEENNLPVVDIFKSVRTSFFIRTSFFLSSVQIIGVNNYSFSSIFFLVFAKIRQMWEKFVDFIRISFFILITIIAIVRRKIINLTNVSFLSSTDDAQTFRKR